uniref:Uncharacterized protein n=1 Tax=Desertifilum tharense IPPAS B-1220 TaxID=1781255 RepID=A0ACD5GP37_9CYAN
MKGGTTLAILQGIQSTQLSAANFTTNLNPLETAPPAPAPPIVPPVRPPLAPPSPTPTPGFTLQILHAADSRSRTPCHCRCG